MPTYTLREKDTGKVFDVFVKYTERQEMLAADPNLEVVISSVPFTEGELKPPSDFMKFVVAPIKGRNKSIFNSRDTRFNIPREW